MISQKEDTDHLQDTQYWGGGAFGAEGEARLFWTGTAWHMELILPSQFTMDKSTNRSHESSRIVLAREFASSKNTRLFHSHPRLLQLPMPAAPLFFDPKNSIDMSHPSQALYYVDSGG